MTTALILVDLQNDFLEGGALGVEGGRRVAKELTQFVNEGAEGFDHLVATQDWHIDPGEHFETWPVHCVAGRFGAEIQEDLHKALSNARNYLGSFKKGQYSDGYSGFDGEKNGEKLEDLLKNHNVDRVVVAGVAADHCVRATALDAVKHIPTVEVWEDMTAGVDPEATEYTFTEELPAAGVIRA